MEGDVMRLGDLVDDHCSRCHMLTDHAVVAIVNNEPAMVRCRTCSFEHKYRKGKSSGKKKVSKKTELFDQVLSKITGGAEE